MFPAVRAQCSSPPPVRPGPPGERPGQRQGRAGLPRDLHQPHRDPGGLPHLRGPQHGARHHGHDHCGSPETESQVGHWRRTGSSGRQNS